MNPVPEYVIIRTASRPFRYYREVNGLGNVEERLRDRATRVPARAATDMLCNEYQGYGLTFEHVKS